MAILLSWQPVESGQQTTIKNDGQRIAKLVNGIQQTGANQIVWDATNQPCGVYIYRLVYGNNSKIRKMTLLR